MYLDICRKSLCYVKCMCVSMTKKQFCCCICVTFHSLAQPLSIFSSRRQEWTIFFLKWFNSIQWKRKSECTEQTQQINKTSMRTVLVFLFWSWCVSTYRVIVVATGMTHNMMEENHHIVAMWWNYTKHSHACNVQKETLFEICVRTIRYDTNRMLFRCSVLVYVYYFSACSVACSCIKSTLSWTQRHIHARTDVRRGRK